MSRYSIERLIEILAERLEPEDMTKKQAREAVGRLSILVDFLCDEFGWDESDREDICDAALHKLEREAKQAEDGDFEPCDDDDDEEEEDDDDDEEDDDDDDATPPAATNPIDAGAVAKKLAMLTAMSTEPPLVLKDI
jgi:hypothetical protein